MIGTKEISEILGVKTVTVRKYAAALEAQGYIIQRDASNNREYTEVDATALRELQALQQRTGLTIEKCAEVIAARHRGASESVAPAVIQPDETQIQQYERRYDELVGLVRVMNEQNQHQAELLAKQAEEIARLHKRLDEQNQGISNVLREVLTTRQMIAATKRKSWKFWKKNEPEEVNGPDPEAAWKRKKDIQDGNY